jgi:aerobic carbon-monoxide dehydrogenase small subunit
MTALAFRLNGSEVAVMAAAPTDRLLDILRENFALTAAKSACRIGRCGACTVLMDGSAVNACLVMAYRLPGTVIVTAEGLDALAVARPLRRALAAEVAFQCGYCAPGMVVALAALLQRDRRPGPAAIREALAGNLCRCTGYQSILRGAQAALRRLASSEETPRRIREPGREQ